MQKWVADNVLNSISEVMRVIITTIYVGVSAWSTMVASSTTIMTIMFVLWLKKLIGYLEFYDMIIIPVATINNYVILPNYYHNIWVLYGSKTHILPYTFTASKYYMSFFETLVSIYLVVFLCVDALIDKYFFYKQLVLMRKYLIKLLQSGLPLSEVHQALINLSIPTYPVDPHNMEHEQVKSILCSKEIPCDIWSQCCNLPISQNISSAHSRVQTISSLCIQDHGHIR